MAVNCLFLKWLLVFRLVTSFPQGFSLQELFPLLYFYNNLKKETPPQPTVPSQCQLNGLFLANCIFVTFGILCQWSVHPKRANNTRLGFLCVFLLSKLRLICPLFIFEGASLTCFHLCCLALRMQTVRLVSKVNLCGFVSQDKNERYMLSCLLWAVELLFRSLSHFLFVVPLGGQKKKVLTLGWVGCKKRCSAWRKAADAVEHLCWAQRSGKKPLDYLTQQQLRCKLHSSSHRRAGCEGRSGAIKCNLVRKQCNLQKAMQTVVEQHSITPAGRCPCSFLHFLLFRQIKKCYCWVLPV